MHFAWTTGGVAGGVVGGVVGGVDVGVVGPLGDVDDGVVGLIESLLPPQPVSASKLTASAMPVRRPMFRISP